MGNPRRSKLSTNRRARLFSKVIHVAQRRSQQGSNGGGGGGVGGSRTFTKSKRYDGQEVNVDVSYGTRHDYNRRSLVGS